MKPTKALAKSIYAAIYAPRHRYLENIFLKEKNGFLLKAHNLPENFTDLFATEILNVKSEFFEYESEEKKHSVAIESFSQKDWDQFLKHLNPVIVSNLKLQDPNRRHLIHAYNFCHSDDQIVTRNRSSAIGAFPLIDQVLAQDEYRNRNNPKPVKGLSFFIANLISDNNLSPAERLDKGQSIEVMRKYFTDRHSTVSDVFLKRTALAPSLQSTVSLNKLLSCDLGAKEQFNQDLYDHRVNNLPSSTKDPKRFQIMLQSSDRIIGQFGIRKSACNLFLNLGNKWLSDETALTARLGHGFHDTLGDYFKIIANDILLPAYFAKLGKDLTSKDVDRLGYIAAELHIISTNNLSSFLTPKTLEDISNRLHRNQGKIDAEKPLFKNRLQNSDWEQWPALIPNQNISGYNYKTLVNQQQLGLEAEEMGNCLRSFNLNCINGESHIIAGKAPNGERFTIELRQVDKVFLINQLYGPNNKDVSDSVRISAHHLQDQINSGEITVNKKCGSKIEDKDLNSLLGFDIFDQKQVQDVFNAHKKARTFPKQLQNYNLSEFIIKSGIAEEIEKLITALHGEKNPTPSTSIATTIMQKLFDKKKNSQDRF